MSCTKSSSGLVTSSGTRVTSLTCAMSLFTMSAISTSSIVINLMLKLRGQSGLVAPVESQGGHIPPSTSVNFHWYETSQNWMSMCNLLKTDYTLCRHLDWNQCRVDWDRSWCLVSQFKCFISCTVLVNIFHSFIPSFRRGIRRMSIGHCSNGVLDLQIQSFPELYYGGFGIGVSRFCY